MYRILLLLFFITTQVKAQPDSVWMYSYGQRTVHDECYAAIATTDGGYLLCGDAGQPYEDERYDDDGYIIKVNNDGEMQWSRRFGSRSNANDRFNGLIQTNDGGFVLVGNYGPSPDAWVVKTDADGEEEWLNLFGDGNNPDRFNCVVQTENGNIFAGGYTYSYGELEGSNCLLVKMDENGDEVWLNTYGTDGRDECNGLIQTEDGGFALVGTSSGNMYLVKVDADGEEEWSQTYETDVGSRGWSLVQMHDGGYALGGFLTYFNDRGFTSQETYIVRTDSTGEMLWARDYLDLRIERCFSIIEVNDEHLVLASSSYWYGQKFGITRIDSDGEVVWDAYYGLDPYPNVCYSIMPTDDNGYALAGTSYIPGGYYDDFALLKTEADPASVPQLLDPAYPNEFDISTPYPNPFNSSTTIRYQLPKSQQVTMRIFDINGRETTTLLINEQLQAGSHQIIWNATDQPTGIYFAQLQSSGMSEMKKLVLVR